MLSVYSSTQCTYKMQSLTMTQKDLAIDRRQIPARGKGSAQRFGDRKGSGETNTGITPSPRFVVNVKSVVLFSYLYNQKVGQRSSSGCLSSSSSSGHRRDSGVALPAGEAASSTTSSWGRCGPASWSRPGWHRRGAQRRRRPEEDEPPDLSGKKTDKVQRFAKKIYLIKDMSLNYMFANTVQCRNDNKNVTKKSPCHSFHTGTWVSGLSCAWRHHPGVQSLLNGSRWPSPPSPWSGLT